MITVADAINSLRPGSEYTMREDDITTIEWHTEGVKPITQAEVDAEIVRLTAAQAEQAALQDSGRRKIAEASGLTPEEMAALGF